MRSPLIISLILTAVFAAGCAPSRPPVPAGVIPEVRPLTNEEEQYGHTVLSELSEKYQLDFNDPRLETVNRVVDKLTKAAGADKDPWHIYLFKDATVKNAAATRGNHVFIWTGMLDYAPTEAELATVLSHELAHVLAGHTDPDPNEEVKSILIQVGAAAVGIAISATTRDPWLAQNLSDIGSSLTEQLGNGMLVNPYSQQTELEADEVGLMIMAKAHYDPQAAIDFWTKMEHDPSSSADIQFFSTHPAAAERLQKLREALPLAEAYYQGHNPAPQPKAAAPPPHPVDPDSFAVDGLPAGGAKIDPKTGTAAEKNFANAAEAAGNSGVPIHRKGFWRVTLEKAQIYREPSSTSEKLGTLNKGDLFLGEEEHRGGWIKLTGAGTGDSGAGNASPGYVERLSLQRAIQLE